MNNYLNKTVKLIDLGQVDYKLAWDYQQELFDGIVELKIENRKRDDEQQEITPNYLLFCEHPHVFTLGKSGSEDHLLIDKQELESKNISYYKINRGGDITYHGPGQIVSYPVLDLDNFFTDIHKYLRLLEEAVIQTLKEYGLNPGRIPGLTGVWLDYEDLENARKICAFGVKSSRWVTMHGLALNVNTHMDYFDYIVPCGIEDKAVTSMEKELGRKQDLQEVKDLLKQNIASAFEMNILT